MSDEPGSPAAESQESSAPENTHRALFWDVYRNTAKRDTDD